MNKKIIFILGIIVLCTFTFLAGIFLGKSMQKTRPLGRTFYATIEEVKENSILVTGLSVNDINFRWDYNVIISKDTMILWRGTELKLEDLDIGDKVSITYTDEIVYLSSPATLREVRLIQLLDDSIEMNKGTNNDTTNQSAIELFNNQFFMYEGKQKGTNICALIKNTLTASNLEHQEDASHIVSLKYQGSGGELEDIYIIPNVNDIKQKEMLDFANLIDKEHFYYVEVQTGDNGLVKEVIIHYDM